jgi:hypothetical protein
MHQHHIKIYVLCRAYDSSLPFDDDIPEVHDVTTDQSFYEASEHRMQSQLSQWHAIFCRYFDLCFNETRALQFGNLYLI